MILRRKGAVNETTASSSIITISTIIIFLKLPGFGVCATQIN